MALKRPNSMDECAYYTQRAMTPDQKGDVTVWVFKQTCIKCKKAMMGKPKGKEGKVQIRALEYQCPSCKFTIEKGEYEDTLTASIAYECPYCEAKGELEMPFKRKKVARIDPVTKKKTMVDALRFQCVKCKKDLDVTRKLK